MNLLSPIKKYMQTELISVTPEDNLKYIDYLFKNHKIHHLLVLRQNQLKGIISKSDFLFFRRNHTNKEEDKILEELRLKSNTAKVIMTEKVATLNKDDKLNVALEIFKENLFHAIPIEEGGKIVGILTTYDIIKNLADDKEATNEYTND